MTPKKLDLSLESLKSFVCCEGCVLTEVHRKKKISQKYVKEEVHF